MKDVDRDYYRQRLAEELERSSNAGCDIARLTHHKLAEFYRQRLNAPEPHRYRGTSSSQTAA